MLLAELSPLNRGLRRKHVPVNCKSSMLASGFFYYLFENIDEIHQLLPAWWDYRCYDC